MEYPWGKEIQVCSNKVFFSRTTMPISIKLGRKYAWGMGIQICSNKGVCPFWGPVKGKLRKHFINLQKSSSHEPLTKMY